MPHPAAEKKKNEGNAHFKAGRMEEAIEKYGEAIDIDGTNAAYWSNRSAAYASMGDWENAAADGEGCIKANKNFVKGYFRLATAQKNMNMLEAASNTLKLGIGVDPSNGDLKKLIREVDDLVRGEKVAALTSQAGKLLANDDYSGAMKAAEQGLRLDGENSELQAILDEARPIFEQQEKKRRANLSREEQLKEEGDDFYKSAKFEKAIEKYSKCLDTVRDKSSELALKCYANRSACYKQLNNFDGIISDTSMVLEADPENVKALVRRAQAFEAMERYRYALQDVRTVLQMPMDKVGASSYQLANGMQHRLNRVVQQLKQG